MRSTTHGLVNFEYPEDAIAALDALAVTVFGKKPAAEKPMAAAATQMPSVKLMDFLSARELLAQYGIEHVGEFVRTKEELDAVFEKLRGKPAAMKVVSNDVSHKTDVGGVQLHIADAAAAREAWDEIAATIRRKVPGAAIQGMLVQPMMQGTEVIIGMKRDPVFGPVITFGLGGVFVEIMKDVSLRVAPVDAVAARAMMEEIKGAALLHGARGQKPVNAQVLVKLIAAVSRLALAHSAIQAIDLNPVIATDKGAVVVDTRVVVG